MEKNRVDYINTIIPRIVTGKDLGLLNTASKKTKKKWILHPMNGKIKHDSVAGQEVRVTWISYENIV